MQYFSELKNSIFLVYVGLDGGKARSLDEGSTEEATRVTRSIMIVKPPGYGSSGNDSTPASPAGSTPPVSPFSGKYLKCHICPFDHYCLDGVSGDVGVWGCGIVSWNFCSLQQLIIQLQIRSNCTGQNCNF